MLATLATLVLAGLVGLALGGWYYSDQLLEAPTPADGEMNLVITATDAPSATVTIDAEGGDAALPTVGLETPDGLLMLEGPAEATEAGLTRHAQMIEGTWPEPGTPARAAVHTFPGAPGEALGIPHDDIDVHGELGVLPAWRVIPPGAREDAPWAVIIHGRGSSRSAGNRLLPTLSELGVPSLVVSLRNSPQAPAAPDGYGRYGDTEWRDLQAAVAHLLESEGAEEVVLIGLSQGASVAGTFLRRSPLSDVSAGAVLVSPLVSLDATLRLQARERDIPDLLVPPLLQAAKWISSARAGIRFDALEHERHVGEWPRDLPVLITHGSRDRTVPLGPSRRLAERLGRDARYEEYAGTGHLREWNTDRARFEDDLRDFFAEEVLTEEPVVDTAAAR